MFDFLISIKPNTDTLRYFYSSIFQGFAAIITLGAMYYLYFFGKISNDKVKLENDVEKIIDMHFHNLRDNAELNKQGFMVYVINILIPEREKDQNLYIDALKSLTKKYKDKDILELLVKEKVFRNLKNGLIILINSMISLLLIGYDLYLNILILFNAIFITIYSIIFIIKLKNLFKITLEKDRKLGYVYPIEIEKKRKGLKKEITVRLPED